MKEHDAVFLKSLSDISLIVLGFIGLFMGLMIGMQLFAMLTGSIISDDQLYNLVIQGVVGAFCYQAMLFINNFQENRIEPYLS